MSMEKHFRTACLPEFLPYFSPWHSNAGLINKPQSWLVELKAFCAGFACFHCLKCKWKYVAFLCPCRSVCRLREMWSRAAWWETSSTSTRRREHEDCGRYKRPENAPFTLISDLSLHEFRCNTWIFGSPLCLHQGVSLTAQRAAIVVGVELPVYDITKKHLILSGYMGDTVYTHFL